MKKSWGLVALVFVLGLVLSGCRDEKAPDVEERDGHLAMRIDEEADWLKVLDLALLSAPEEEGPGEIDQDAEHVLWRLDEEDEYSPLIANEALIALYEGIFDPEEARLRLNEGRYEWFHEEKEAWLLLFDLDMVHETYVLAPAKDRLDAPRAYSTLPSRIPLLETFVSHYDRYEEIELFARHEDYDDESGLYFPHSDYDMDHVREGTLVNFEGECREGLQVCHGGENMDIRITDAHGNARFEHEHDFDWDALAGGSLTVDVESLPDNAQIVFRLAEDGPIKGIADSEGVHSFDIEGGFTGRLQMDLRSEENDEIFLNAISIEDEEGEMLLEVPATKWNLLMGDAVVSVPDAVGIWMRFTYDTYGHYFGREDGYEMDGDIDAPYAFFGTYMGFVLMADEFIEEAILPEGLEELGAFAFSRARNLKDVHLPDSLRIIHRGAFYNLMPPENGGTPFMSDELTKIVVPDGVHTIENIAFSNPYLETVILPDSDEIIGTGVFSRSGIATIDLPSALDFIPGTMFRFSALETLTLHENIWGVGEGAFQHTKDFETLVILHEEVLFRWPQSFDNTNEDLEIFVPDELVLDYKSDEQWLDMADNIRPLSEHGAD